MEQKQLTFSDLKFESDVNKLNKRRNIKFKIDRYMKDVNIILNIFWAILLGLNLSCFCILAGLIYFITIVGVPFGIVLYKLIPLVFRPVNKRVILNFGDFWFLNTAWLLFGGFIFGLVAEALTILCYISIIGIPIGIQLRKIALYFFAPFGAEIVDNDEFSDEEIEKQAYTMQYIRKNRINVDYELLNVDSKDKEIISNLTNVKYSFTYHIFRISYASIITLFLLFIYFISIFFILKNIGFFDSNFFKFILDIFIMIPSSIHKVILFLLTPLINVLSYVFSFLNINIYLVIDSLIDICVLSITFLILIKIIELILIIFSGIVLLKVKRKRIFDYGFATRKELVKQYNSNFKLIRKYSDLIHIIYKIYENEINEEIRKDTQKRKIQNN